MAISAPGAQKGRVAAKRLHMGPLWQDHDLVFPGELGQPVVSRTARDHFARLAIHAGISDATPHTLQHSTGTFLLAAGVPDRIVQAILGHGSAAMTRHYQHVLPAMLTDAGARLAQFMQAAGSRRPPGGRSSAFAC
jgi:site-specific recombinase XerD